MELSTGTPGFGELDAALANRPDIYEKLHVHSRTEATLEYLGR